MEKKEIREAIDNLLSILEANFGKKSKEQIGYDEIFEMCQDLHVLFQNDA